MPKLKYTPEEIQKFLDSWGTRGYKREDPAMTELMMDNHTYVEYRGKGYYLPEESMMMDALERNILEYLNEKHHI